MAKLDTESDAREAAVWALIEKIGDRVAIELLAQWPAKYEREVEPRVFLLRPAIAKAMEGLTFPDSLMSEAQVATEIMSYVRWKCSAVRIAA